MLALSKIYDGGGTRGQKPRSKIDLKGKKDFSTNKDRSKCDTFSLCNFD